MSLFKSKSKQTALQALVVFFEADKTAAIQGYRDHLDKTVTQDTTFELIDGINKQLQELENLSSHKAEIKKWNISDRISWFIKEAYIQGYLAGVSTVLELNKEEL